MASSKNLNNLVINKVESQEVYDKLKATHQINEDELYLIEGEEDKLIDIQINGVSILTADKVANFITNSQYNKDSNKIATMNDLPVVNNNILTIQKNGTSMGTVSLNADSDKTINIPITKQDVGLNNVENKSSATIRGEITSNNVTNALGFTPLNSNLKGANNGIAELDSSGKVPSTQLPSYVDDVLEYNYNTDFPSVGETGKIYIATSTNKTYRWSGSAYVEISASLALGTTSSTAFRGDYGNVAYQHAVTNKGSQFASGLYKITTNEEGHVTAATAVVKADITKLGIPAQDTTYNAATTTTMGLMSAEDKAKLNNIEANANNYTLPTASATLGGVKTTSNVSSPTGYTSCPIINGVVYYKDTNTTYNVVTPSIDGLMSAADKTKLDSLRVTSQVTVSEIEPSNMIEGDI